MITIDESKKKHKAEIKKWAFKQFKNSPFEFFLTGVFSLIYLFSIMIIGSEFLSETKSSLEIDFSLNGFLNLLSSLTIGVVVVISIRFFSSIHRDLFGSKLYKKAQVDLLHKLSINLKKLKNKLSNAEIIHRVTTDYDLLADALSQGLLQFLSQIIVGVFGFSYILWKFPSEVSKIVFFTFFGVGVFWFLRKKIKVISFEKQKSENKIFSQQKNFIEGFEYHITSNRLKERIEKYEKVFSDWFKVERRAAYLQHMSGTLNWGVRYLFIVIIISPIILTQEIPTELVYWIYVLLGVLSQLFSSIYYFGQIEVHIERSIDLIKEEKLVEKRHFSSAIDIKADELKIYFGSDQQKMGIKDLTFSWKEGDRIWIQGISGIGKTTLLRTLVGLHGNFTGELLVPDQEVSLGFLPQKPFFFEGESLKENLGIEKLSLYGSELVKKLKIESLFTNLNTKIGQEEFQPSEGQKVRLALFRELIKEPKLLILDEPTASLDKENSEIIMSILREESEGRLTIVCEHDESLKNIYVPSNIVDLE